MGGRGSNSMERVGGQRAQGGRPNDATEYYVSGDGMWINQYLRGRVNMAEFGELSDSEKQYLKDLDAATRGTVKEKTLYRSVDASAIFSGGDLDNLRQYLQYGPDSWGKGAYAKSISDDVKAMIDNALGKTINEKGFMSASKDFAVARDWGGFTGASHPVVMEIQTTGNTKGVDLSGYDKNVAPEDAQKEVLLARGQSYKVESVSFKDSAIIVKVKMK